MNQELVQKQRTFVPAVGSGQHKSEAVRPLILCSVACCWTHFVEVIAFPLANGLFATIIRSELSVAKVSPFGKPHLSPDCRLAHAIPMQSLKYKSILQYLGVESTCQHFVGAKSTPWLQNNGRSILPLQIDGRLENWTSASF